MIRQDAEKAILHGVYAALFSGLITGGISVLAILSNQPVLGIDGWSLIDAVIIFLLAFGVYKKSRVAAGSLLAYFILSKVIMMVESGSGSGVLSGLLFLYFYAKAIEGTIAFHRIEKLENPDYQPSAIWVVGIVSSIVGLFVAFFLTIFLIGVFSTAPAGVVSGYELEPEARQELEDANILFGDDQVELIYSYGTSILEGGNILTTDRFIHYAQKGGKTQKEEIALDQITEVVHKPNDEVFGDSVYLIKGETTEVKLILSWEEEDQIFLRALKRNIPVN